jgi:hypothetical protein
MNTDSLNAFFKRFQSGVRGDPVRDWLVLLTLSLFAFIAIVVWNAWTFGTVARGGTIGTVVTSTPAVFDRASINTIRTVFEMRAAEEAKYVTGVYRYADPSQ